MKIIIHPKFHKQFVKLPFEVREKAEAKLNILMLDPYDSSLKKHKLHGKFSEFWAISINYEYRIILRFIDDDKIWLYQIGKHDICD